MADKKLIEKIQNLLADLESDRVERTISTTNTDKFGQAICAFANDLPGSNKPGYLLIGTEDDGKVHPIRVTDELLKNIAAIRTDGNIQPQPSMTVQKVTMPEGDIIVVEVQPAKFPPVKYKGRIWVRVGPRKSVANENDEKLLYEKRAANIITFDAMPCVGATLEDLDLNLFKQQYLPKAVPEDVLRQDNRDVELQLQSLGFFDKRFGCPTYAGIILFGKTVERFLPGAYVQYVKFGGKSRGAQVMSEYKFAGNLCKILTQLDTFVDVSITNRRPVPITTLREKTVTDYPHWATRELLMNACCHRDYESNGPIQFYQYADRIELLNPGGLYGKVNPQNFPTVNDYRNPIVAEAMKVLGFVNRFSRGVMRVNEELQENGNGEAEFSLELGTAFLVIEHLSKDGLLYADMETQDLAENGDDGIQKPSDVNKDGAIESQKPSNMTENGNEGIQKPSNVNKKEAVEAQKPSNVNVDGTVPLDEHIVFPTRLIRNTYEAIRCNPKVKYAQLQENLGVAESTIQRAIQWLKENGYINKERSKIRGVWQLIRK